MDRARRSVANMVASEARFAVMSGPVAGPVLDHDRRVYETIALSYDMNKHGGSGAQIDVLTDDFIDEFAIVGPALALRRARPRVDRDSASTT